MSKNLDLYYEDRSRGYTRIIREELLLGRVLSGKEFFLYLLIKFLVTDWDTRHKKYGSFTYDEKQLQYYTSWKTSTVYKTFRSLVKKGYFLEAVRKLKLYEVVGYKLQDVFIKEKQNDMRYFQELLTNVEQERISQKNDKTLPNLTKELQEQSEFFPNFTTRQVKWLTRTVSSYPKYSSYLVSSKGNSSFSPTTKDTKILADDEALINNILVDIEN